MDDSKIIELFESRDEAAISAVSEKYGSYCFVVANNVLSNDRDAEECVNDAWLKIWNSIPPARPGHLRAFVAKITRHIALDRYRSSSALKRGGGELTVALEEVAEIVESGVTVESELEQRAISAVLDRFLRSLPCRERNIFIRRYFFVEPIRRISLRYGVSENNVSQILSRTRQKLKKFLEAEGIAL